MGHMQSCVVRLALRSYEDGSAEQKCIDIAWFCIQDHARIYLTGGFPPTFYRKKTDRHIQQKRNDSSASESSGLTPTTYDAWEKTVPAQYDIASYGIEMNHALHGVTLRPHTEHCFKDKLAAEIARR